MRYKRISSASWAIALLLAGVALATALLRSRPWEAAQPPTPVAEEGVADDWRPLGSQVFLAQCASCHPGGEAVGRAIPPLRVRFVERFHAPGGREATLDLLLAGTSLEGEAGSHPDYPELSDRELAAVVNHMLASWGNEALLPPEMRWMASEEVAGQRP